MADIDQRGAGDARAEAGNGISSTASGPVSFVIGARRFLIVDLAGAGIASLLAKGAGGWNPQPGDLGTPDVRYVVESWRSRWGVSGLRLSRDGALHYLGSGAEEAARWLRRDIEEDVARTTSADVILDATAVVWRERAILIAGQGRSGTSNLAAELVRHGAAPWSDGLVVLDGEGRLRAAAGATAASAPPVALVVSTTCQPEVSWEPRRLRGSRAVLPIVDSAHPGVEGLNQALRVAARLATSVLTLEGAHSQASIAAPDILATLDERLDRREPMRPRAAARRGALSRAQRAIIAARDPREPVPRRRSRVAEEPSGASSDPRESRT